MQSKFNRRISQYLVISSTQLADYAITYYQVGFPRASFFTNNQNGPFATENRGSGLGHNRYSMESPKGDRFDFNIQ